MKICRKCGKEGEFSPPTNKKKDNNLCVLCKREYSKDHYERNKQDYIQKSEDRKKRLYEDIVSKAKNKPCTDCHNSFPIVCMDFDHVYGEKSFTISSSYNSVPLQALVEEIAKCEIVCANCHRIRTANRILRARGPVETTVGYEPTNLGAHPGVPSILEVVA